MEQQSLLSDMEFNPVFSSTGKRFLNYLIDLAVFYALIFFYGFFGAVIGYDQVNTENTLMLYLVLYLIFIGYYSLCEIIFKGRTVGKFITGTKAVNEDGTEMEPKTVMLRTLSRMVPLEPFSALGNPSHPWHDKWTRTHVIDVRKTEQNNLALQQS